MRIDKRQFVTGAAALAAAGLTVAPAAGAEGLIKITVGFPPGGAGDLFARMFAERLREELGRPIVIENNAGAGGLTAAESFRRQPPDGSALMIHTGSTAITAPISRKSPPYDPLKDYLWIALLSVAPFGIAVSPSVPAKDLREFLDYVRSQPGKLSYGSAGVASSTHLAAELFKERAGGLDIVHVPYRGSAAAITDVLTGILTFIVDPLSTLLPQHRDGKLRILAVMDAARAKVAPEIPTTKEFGLDVPAGTCNLLVAPLGTPPSVIEPIAAATAKVCQRPDFQAQLAEFGIEPITGSSPDKARAFVAGEIARWTPIVQRLGIAL